MDFSVPSMEMFSDFLANPINIVDAEISGQAGFPFPHLPGCLLKYLNPNFCLCSCVLPCMHAYTHAESSF